MNIAELAQEQQLNAMIQAARGQTPSAKAANARIKQAMHTGYPLKPSGVRIKKAFNQTLAAFAITPLILAMAFVMHIFAGL